MHTLLGDASEGKLFLQSNVELTNRSGSDR